MEHRIKVEDLRAEARSLRAGDRVLLTGTVYTARDAAHKELFRLLDAGGALPFPLRDAVIYYAGPTQTPPGGVIGSCGPTTSGRMDPYAPRLLDLGLGGMIGKGERSQAVKDAVVRNGGIYLCAIGGAGVLAAARIQRCEVIAFEHLGCESVKRLYVEDFPLIVGLDPAGGDLFAEGRAAYAAKLNGQ